MQNTNGWIIKTPMGENPAGFLAEKGAWTITIRHQPLTETVTMKDNTSINGFGWYVIQLNGKPMNFARSPTQAAKKITTLMNSK